MAMLPEEQRTAIILKEYHGLTFQEIADMLECPLSTVKTRLYQGLSVLRRQLARTGVQNGAAGTAVGTGTTTMCDKELLVADVYDDIIDMDRARVERHLRECAACRAEAIARRAPSATISRRGMRRSRRRGSGWCRIASRRGARGGRRRSASPPPPCCCLPPRPRLRTSRSGYGANGLRVRTGWNRPLEASAK